MPSSDEFNEPDESNLTKPSNDSSELSGGQVKTLRELLAAKSSTNSSDIKGLPTIAKVESDSIEKTAETAMKLNEVLTNPHTIEKELKKTELHNRANAILAENNWQESDIPMNSDYWSLKNQLRGLK